MIMGDCVIVNLLLQNTAVMLIITQLLPGLADTVYVVTDPSTATVWFVTDEPHMHELTGVGDSVLERNEICR